jgi:hypothetical protein
VIPFYIYVLCLVYTEKIPGLLESMAISSAPVPVGA